MSQLEGTVGGIGDEGARGPVRVAASFCVKRKFYDSLEEPAGRERLVIGRGRGADVAFSEHRERTTHEF